MGKEVNKKISTNKNKVKGLGQAFFLKGLLSDSFISNKSKTFSCRRLETKRCSVRNVEFGFRRKAQVRSNSRFNLICPYRMQRRHHQGEEETKARAKNGVPLPPDGFSMPCKRQALISSLHPYSLPFFIPLHFACRQRPNPVHLFAHFSIAMGFTPFFYLLFFG